MNAIIALLTRYPHFAAPVLAWAVGADSLSLSARMEAVAALTRGAYVLSGLPLPGELTQKPDAAAADSRAAEEAATSSGNKGRTIVTRPRRLATMRRTKVFFANNFAPISELVFSAVLSVVSGALLIDGEASDKLNLPAYQSTSGLTSGTGSNYKAPLDGIQLLLPSQCLLALASFVRCSVNTLQQR
jgi:hypothetical protein